MKWLPQAMARAINKILHFHHYLLSIEQLRVWLSPFDLSSSKSSWDAGAAKDHRKVKYVRDIIRDDDNTDKCTHCVWHIASLIGLAFRTSKLWFEQKIIQHKLLPKKSRDTLMSPKITMN